MKKFLFFILIFLSFNLFSEEKILSYDVIIEIQPSSEIIVTENIKVIAEGYNIKRGVYRDFPVDYRDNYGNKYRVTFEIIQILRNGVEEPYFKKREGRNIRVYIGKKDYFLENGEYTYTIKFKTKRQLGYFKDHDELYFNVIGTNWVFPIESATCKVILPSGVPADKVKVDGFTGPAGATLKNFEYEIFSEGIFFKITSILNPYEGFTIVVGWPKGFVKEPTGKEKFLYLLKDNSFLWLDFILLFGVFFYYMRMWKKYGKDPEKGVIYPQYEPPKGFEPEDVRYLKKMVFDDKGFSSFLVKMAIKGALKIEKEGKKIFLHKLDPVDNLNQEERKVLEALFPFGSKKVEVVQHNYKKFQDAEKIIENKLKKRFGNIYFSLNTGKTAIGCIFSVLLGFFFWFQFVSYKIFALFFLFILIILNIIFWKIMPARSLMGRKIMDQIEGFKMFLKVADEDILKKYYPDGKTPELYEKYFPYAMALDMESEWGEQFEDAFKNLEQKGESYTPSWYSGAGFSLSSLSSFSSTLGSSFSSSLSSSSS
ncbi:MAG: DUF2207 domain-containing protein, partial [Thermoanaerobaculia bacterium]